VDAEGIGNARRGEVVRERQRFRPEEGVVGKRRVAPGRDIVEEEGWPTLTLVGDDGASAAWLLIQHADNDPSFQRTCLDLMKALPPQETVPQHIAYLTDRVLLAAGQSQVYGTQMEIANGTHQPRNLRDPATVDQRRAEVGLGSIAEYIHSMNRDREDH